MLELEYIVTGTGRCGTLFAANYLTSAGVPCTHEAVFTPAGLDFAFRVLDGSEKAVSSKISKGDNLSDCEIEISAESSYMAAPFLRKFPNTKTIHLVRNPMDVVGSFLGMGYFVSANPSPLPDDEQSKENCLYERFIHSFLDELGEDMTSLDRACLYWAAWNEMIEASGMVAHRHRLEDPVEGLSGFLGREGNYSNRRCNTMESVVKKRWSPNQIQNPSVRRRLKDVAKRYGYLSILH